MAVVHLSNAPRYLLSQAWPLWTSWIACPCRHKEEYLWHKCFRSETEFPSGTQVFNLWLCHWLAFQNGYTVLCYSPVLKKFSLDCITLPPFNLYFSSCFLHKVISILFVFLIFWWCLPWKQQLLRYIHIYVSSLRPRSLLLQLSTLSQHLHKYLVSGKCLISIWRMNE